MIVRKHTLHHARSWRAQGLHYSVVWAMTVLQGLQQQFLYKCFIV